MDDMENMATHTQEGTFWRMREGQDGKDEGEMKAKTTTKIFTKCLPWKRDIERSRLTEDEARSMQTIYGNKKASQVRIAEIGDRAASRRKPARTNVVSR